jgi:RNA polymerase sigma factor (sigma-70 family)
MRTVLNEAEQQQAEAVFVEHRAFVESVARRHSPHPQDVPDIVATVGMKICRSFGGFQGRAKIESWLFRVTVNAARDHHRRGDKQIRVIDRSDMLDPQTEAVVMADPAIQNERVAAVHEAIKKLRPKYRRIILAELADRNKPMSKRKARSEAMNQLRQILEADPRVMN